MIISDHIMHRNQTRKCYHWKLAINPLVGFALRLELDPQWCSRGYALLASSRMLLSLTWDYLCLGACWSDRPSLPLLSISTRFILGLC